MFQSGSIFEADKVSSVSTKKVHACQFSTDYALKIIPGSMLMVWCSFSKTKIYRKNARSS